MHRTVEGVQPSSKYEGNGKGINIMERERNGKLDF